MILKERIEAFIQLGLGLNAGKMHLNSTSMLEKAESGK